MKKVVGKQNTLVQQERQLNNQTPLHKTSKISSQTDIPIQRPYSGKKIQTSKNLPPKNPKNKVQYIQADNMTESRIQQARNGLQLLKKKLSQKGLSREKPKYQQEKIQINAKPGSQLKIPIKVQSKQTIPQSSPINKSQSKKNQNFKNTQEGTITKKQYFNPAEEIAIKPKQDFYKLLQKQMKKQNTNNTNKTNSKQYQLPQDDGNMELLQCSKGCGRMFNEKALPKHEKICQKVFLSKRKAFDSAQHRQIQDQGFNKPPQLPVSNKNKKLLKETVSQKHNPKMPKWKLQSAAFRAGLKATNGKALTAQEKAVTQMEKQQLVLCNFCGRRFNNNAAQRHIPFCQKKAKQIPKMNTTISKKK